MKKIKQLLIVLMFIVTGLYFAAALNAENIPRISKEQLRKLFDQSDLIILDVRTKRDWKASKHKIQGAERAAPGDFSSWVDKYPKDKIIVLYCA
jgi:rhodanese-related sulfurtransferase